MTVRTQPSRDLTDLSVRQDVGHDGERRDEADAHVPPEVGQEVVERVAELERFFKNNIHYWSLPTKVELAARPPGPK